MEMEPEKRFSRVCQEYARARPGYGREVWQYVASICGIASCELASSALVADIGCGTGISTRELSASGFRVVGVEPNPDMLRKALENKEGEGSLSYRSGTAEDTGLAGAACDLVVCAQSFHWFDPLKALAEFHRILKENGWVCLIWNERDDRDSFTRDYSTIVQAASPDSQVEEKRQKAWQALAVSNLFTNYQTAAFSNIQTLSLPLLLDRFFSSSYLPARESKLGMSCEEQLRFLFERYKNARGLVNLVYETRLYMARKATVKF